MLCSFLRNEFSIKKHFKIWFEEHSGPATILLSLFVFTDASLIVSAFTGQIFGKSIFHSPISRKGVTFVQTWTIVSLFIEHSPQLAVQCYYILDKSHHFNSIIFFTLMVSCIDIIFIAVKRTSWIIVAKVTHVQDSKKDNLL